MKVPQHFRSRQEFYDMHQNSDSQKTARVLCQHDATIGWRLHEPSHQFLQGQYSRAHEWRFDGGLVLPASPSPHVVSAPWSNAESVDPEEAFVAAVASCHMLTLLWLLSKRGFIATAYCDNAVGMMTRNEHGVPCVSRIELHPRITWAHDYEPTENQLTELHHEAHRQCYIANSVKTEIVVISAVE